MRLLFFFLLLSNSFSALAQSQSALYGKAFRVGFMENSSTPQNLSLYITAKEKSTVTVQVPVLGTFSFEMSTNSDTLLSLPVAVLLNNQSELIQNKSVGILSTQNIQVVAFNNAPFSSDAVSIVPIEHLPRGGRYLINTFRGSSAFPSQFLVVATEDNTEIEITPKVQTKGGRTANQPFTVTLQAGQSYLVQAADTGSLSGSLVRSAKDCKKWVVFSGARCSQVNYNAGCSGCDHLWEQELPTSLWGKEYVSLPMIQLNNGYFLQFLAANNNTVIQINGVPTYTLQAGQSQLHPVNFFQSVCIQSNEIISVVQLLKSGECNGHPARLSDPSMLRLVASHNSLYRAYFSPPTNSNLSSTFLHIVCDDTSGIRINSLPTSSSTLISSCNAKQHLIVPLTSPDPVFIQGVSPFIAYAYAYGNAESYALSIGSTVENQELNFEHLPSTFEYCDPKQEIQFRSKSQGYHSMRWLFTPQDSSLGDTASFRFPGPGKYTVSLIGSKPGNDCPNDTLSKEFTFFAPPEVRLGPDTLVCKKPDLLIVPTTQSTYQFLWHNGSTAKNYLAAMDQKIWLRVTDSNGCQGSDTMEVRFDDCLVKKIEIPNVFTPGKDNYNDAFIITLDVYTDAYCIIYNRWGQVIYEYNPQRDKAWNGGVANAEEMPCPDGTYFYMLYFTDPDTQIRYSENGTITLLRERY